MQKKTITTIAIIVVALVILLTLFFLAKNYLTEKELVIPTRQRLSTEKLGEEITKKGHLEQCKKSEECEDLYKCIGVQGLPNSVCEDPEVAKEYQDVITGVSSTEKLTVR